MRRFFRDLVRKIVGIDGNTERAERNKRAKDNQRVDKIISGREEQLRTATLTLQMALHNMRQE